MSDDKELDELLAAMDPEHPDYREALVDYRDAFGQDPEPERAPVPLDIDAVNVALRRGACSRGPL